MSTTGSKVHQLIREARIFLESGNCTDINKMVKELTDKLAEYLPIVNPPAPATENPNAVAWRPMVIAGLEDAVRDIQILLGDHVKITATTNIRRSVMKDGGIKARLSIKFQAKTTYNRDHNYVRIIQRKINERLQLNGLPFAAVLTTSGSQMNFNARVYIEGDDDYSTYVRMARL